MNADLDSCIDGIDLLEKWELWDESFTRRLDVSEYPISIVLRTESPVASMRVGVFDRNGRKFVHDIVGEVIRDDITGEFLAAVITGRDVTMLTEEMTQIKERDDERFKLICDTMPQLVWTTLPDGEPDFFNSRWYNYTGLTAEECLGDKWTLSFHPDDRPAALARWKRSMETGDPYVMEYRCLSKDGEWRWFLSRALAIRHKETGEIEKWFGKTIVIVCG
jgi:PAS domain S-box-containing protein